MCGVTKGDMISAAKAANKAKLNSQTVTVDKDWKIHRFDPLNWEIRFKGDKMGYFPTVSGALKALPAKMLNEEARGTLTDVLRSVESIDYQLARALP